MAPHSDCMMTSPMQPQTWRIMEGSSSSSMVVDDISESSCQTTKTSNRVRFNEDTKIVAVPSRCDLSHEEFKATWFNEDDYAEVNMEIELTECAMACETNRHMVDDELLCARGISDTDSLLLRAECNAFIQKLVLNQIAFLSAQGTEDVGVVAKVYRDCSAPAVKQALQVARRDAADALEYHALSQPQE